MTTDFYNEMYDSAGMLRPHYRVFAEWLDAMERLDVEMAKAELED